MTTWTREQRDETLAALARITKMLQALTVLTVVSSEPDGGIIIGGTAGPPTSPANPPPVTPAPPGTVQ